MSLIPRLTSIALVLATVPAAMAFAQSAPRFAYVDSRVLLQEVPGRVEAEAQFEKEMSTIRSEVQLMGDSLNALVEAYNAEEATLSPTARRARQKVIQEKEAQFQQRMQGLEQQAQKRQFDLMQPITAKISKAIEDIRSEENYTMIFDVGAAGGTVVAADKNLDITQRVLARLRTTATTSVAPSPGAAGPTMPTPVGVAPQKTPPRR